MQKLVENNVSKKHAKKAKMLKIRMQKKCMTEFYD